MKKIREHCDSECDDATNDVQWWCKRYRNRGDLADYLGDTQPWLVEIFAVRLAQSINGSSVLDWCHENLATIILRETSPGIRLAHFLICFIVVVVFSIFLDDPLVLRYSLTMDTLEAKWSDTTLSVALYILTVDVALLCTAYFLVGYDAAGSSVVDLIPFRPAPVARLREDRNRHAQPGLGGVCLRIANAIFYIVYFALGVLSFHTLLSHTYQQRNPYFAALLILQCALSTWAAIADLTFIGSPWGIQENSKIASILLSVRGIVISPLALIWSSVAIAASFPPSYCREC